MILSHVIKDKYLRVISGLGLFVWLLALMIFYATLSSTITPLIIHFEVNKGIDFVAGRAQVFEILALALIIILINLFLTNFLYNRERFLSYIFSFASLELAILILIAISVIIGINY